MTATSAASMGRPFGRAQSSAGRAALIRPSPPPGEPGCVSSAVALYDMNAVAIAQIAAQRVDVGADRKLGLDPLVDVPASYSLDGEASAGRGIVRGHELDQVAPRRSGPAGAGVFIAGIGGFLLAERRRKHGGQDSSRRRVSGRSVVA